MSKFKFGQRVKYGDDFGRIADNKGKQEGFVRVISNNGALLMIRPRCLELIPTPNDIVEAWENSTFNDGEQTLELSCGSRWMWGTKFRFVSNEFAYDAFMEHQKTSPDLQKLYSKRDKAQSKLDSINEQIKKMEK